MFKLDGPVFNSFVFNNGIVDLKIQLKTPLKPEPTSTIGMKMKRIPASESLMGSLDDEVNRSSNEKQQ